LVAEASAALGRRRTRSLPLPTPGGEAVVVALLFAYVLLFSAWPLLRLLWEALGANEAGEPFGVLRESLQSRAARRALWNTLSTSALSVLVSAGLGLLFAFALALARGPGRTAATFLVLLPLVIPSQVMALAWIALLGSSSPIFGPLGLAPEPGATNPLYGAGGIAFLMGVEHMPLVFLAVRASLAGIPNDLVEAARVAGARPWEILRRIIAPLVWPAALAGSILAFAAAIGNFGVPALLGIPGRYSMLTTLIYQRLNGFGPSVLDQVAALSLVLLGLAAAALCLRALLLRRLNTRMERSGANLRPLPLGLLASASVSLALWLALLVLAILPLLALVGSALVPALGVNLSAETLTFENFRSSLAGSEAVRRAFLNSFVLSLAAALICALVAIPFAALAELRRNPLARALDWAADAPFVAPGTVLALAMILVFLPPLPLLGVSIYGTGAILFVAYLARFLPLALRPVAGALGTLDPALDDAGRVAGARFVARTLFITAPLAAPAAFAGALLIFMTAFNELTVSALLWSSGWETVGVMIFSLQYEGNSPAASALSTASVAVVLLLALVLHALGRFLPPGTLPWRTEAPTDTRRPAGAV